MGYADLCASDGCASLYFMNEASGQFADSVGKRPLTQVGTLTRGTAAFPVQGGGITPDGSTGYASASTVALTSSDNITLECWVFLTTPSTSYGCLMTNSPSDSSNGISFGFGNNATGLGASNVGNMITVLYDGVRWNPTAYTVSAGLHLLAITRTTGNLTNIYVDGVFLGASPDPGAPPAAPGAGATSKVGGYITNAGTSPRICNVPVGGAGFYPVALSAAQLLSHYKAGLRESVISGGY